MGLIGSFVCLMHSLINHTKRTQNGCIGISPRNNFPPPLCISIVTVNDASDHTRCDIVVQATNTCFVISHFIVVYCLDMVL